MDSKQTRFDRRALLKAGSALLASFAAFPLAVLSKSAVAAKADRELLRYQDQPRNGKVCSDCWAYVPGRRPGVGTCKAIEGPISANGWCMSYSPKQRRSKTKKSA